MNPVPGTIQGNRATPSTRFHTVVSGVCRDGTAPVVAVHSDATGNDVVPPVLTYLPDDHSQFYVGQVGAASVQARCGSRVAAHALSTSRPTRTLLWATLMHRARATARTLCFSPDAQAE